MKASEGTANREAAAFSTGLAPPYEDLLAASAGLIEGEPDPIATMANVAALLWESLPDVNWVGFYRRIGETLVLGPFQGKTACTRIPIGKGVCGTAAATLTTQRVADVHSFAGHITCDTASASELVVPIVVAGALMGVLDIDSPTVDRFGPADQAGIEALCAALAVHLSLQ